MDSSLIDSAQAPHWDAALMHALAPRAVPADGACPMAIGVEGTDGEVYRVVRTRGLTETVRMLESARALGFAIARGRRAGGHELHRVLRRER